MKYNAVFFYRDTKFTGARRSVNDFIIIAIILLNYDLMVNTPSDSDACILYSNTSFYFLTL